ncbi:MAG: hypothetical protein IJ233_07000, partial [Pyramidobacter sp.]|nr:hypothetical protein [Pyramidobacter sp.]
MRQAHRPGVLCHGSAPRNERPRLFALLTKGPRRGIAHFTRDDLSVHDQGGICMNAKATSPRVDLRWLAEDRPCPEGAS